jgi:hypothetical protein
MSKPRAPRTSVHAAPCCGIRTIFRSADQGAVRREPYRSAKKSSRGCRSRASAQPVHEPVASIGIGMIFGTDRRGNGDQMAHEWTAWLLGQPFGRWAVGRRRAGLSHNRRRLAVRGLRAKFNRQIEANKQKREVVTALGVAGFLALGFIFCDDRNLSPVRRHSCEVERSERHCWRSPHSPALSLRLGPPRHHRSRFDRIWPLSDRRGGLPPDHTAPDRLTGRNGQPA